MKKYKFSVIKMSNIFALIQFLVTQGKGTEGGVFQCGQTDEFQVNLAAVGVIKKIRIGMEECSPDCDWRLKQVKYICCFNETLILFHL